VRTTTKAAAQRPAPPPVKAVVVDESRAEIARPAPAKPESPPVKPALAKPESPPLETNPYVYK
jgi:hypothetical protein